MKISPVIKTAVLVTLLAVFQENLLASGTNIDISKCQALLNIKENLYLSDAAGEILAQYTSDQTSKSGASLAPDGSRVAFIPDDALDSVTVADKDGWKSDLRIPMSTNGKDTDSDADSNKNGGVIDNRDIPDDATLVGTTWINDETLRLNYHISPSTGLFRFIILEPRTTLTSGFHKLATGVDCTIAWHSSETVCIDGRDVTVDNKVVYSDSGFTGSPLQDSLFLKVGDPSAPIQGYPNIQIQAASIDAGKVTLHVTLADGSWIEKTIGINDYMSVLVSESQSIGLFPTKIDGQKISVKLEARVSAQAGGFRSLALWPHFDHRIVLVGTNQAAGTSTITVLSLDNKKDWDVIGPAALPMDGTIGSVRFVSDTQLYFETGVRAGILPISIIKSNSGPTIQVGSPSYFPKKLSVNLNQQKLSSEPLTWVCN